MDTIQHAYDGYVIAKAVELIAGVELPLSVEICSAVVGALPDLIGEAERVVKKNPTLWNWYEIAHSGYRKALSMDFERPGYWKEVPKKTLLWYLRFLPQYGKHLLKDRFTHTSMGAKRNWYPPGEMWKENFFKALAYCWPNWIGWAESVALHFVILRVHSCLHAAVAAFGTQAWMTLL